MSSPQSPFIIRARTVVTSGGVGPVAVHVHGGVIAAIGGYDDVPAGMRVIDVPRGAALLPGLVDTHVHINEPGRTEWEGFETATRAAAAGGVTTLLDMPLNSVPATTTAAAMREKIASAEGRCRVDVGLIAGVVPGNSSEIEDLWNAGAFAFKCFLVHSGVDEFPNVTEADLRLAMPELHRLGALLMAHAELPGPIEAAARTHTTPTAEGARAPDPPAPADPRVYANYLRSRPRQAEHEAIELLLRLAGEFGTRLHIVHLASADAVPMLRDARSLGMPVTVETCPHYLYFAAEHVRDGDTRLKCAPPIRERENRERLWDALHEGVIDSVVSDHSPCPPRMKERESGDFMRAWGGIDSLQLGLSAMWQGAQARKRTLADVVRWMATAPARIAGLGARKGAIAVGRDADLVVWHPDEHFIVSANMLHSRNKLTPYDGLRLPGVVETTYLRGEAIYHQGEFVGEARGRVLRRSVP